MNDIEIGKFVSQQKGYKAFVPNPFPPKGGFEFDQKIVKKCAEATRLLGKLDGITKLLSDADFFLMYLRKDAASSSQIEGTKATMVDVIEAEVKTAGIPDDVDDILHYIKALDYGMDRVIKDEFPISLRLIRDLHNELMRKARATHHSYPGEFRTSQNWIGGSNLSNARFITPPVSEMNRSLGDLEKFIHADDDLLPLIKAGLIHSQFETIHPFNDGNGRTGRMLITFYLWKAGLLEKPVLFLSSYFRKYQEVYYEKLAAYHGGSVSDWIEFFLDGVVEIAIEAIETVSKITELRDKDILKIQTLGKRASESACKVLPKLYEQPIVNAPIVQKWVKFTRAGAQAVIDRFVELDILLPKDEDIKYGQTYVYKEYLDIFTKDINTEKQI